MDIKILLALAAGAYFLTSKKATAQSGPNGPLPQGSGPLYIPSNSPGSEQALLETLAPGSVQTVAPLAPYTVNTPVAPIAPSSPGVVVPRLTDALPGALSVEAWSCPEGQIPNPEAVAFQQKWGSSGIQPRIAFQRCVASAQRALDAGNVAPAIPVTPLNPLFEDLHESYLQLF